MRTMRTTKTSKKKKIRKRIDIEKQFLGTEDVVLRVGLTEAVVSNQKLILETLLDVRDLLQKSLKKRSPLN